MSVRIRFYNIGDIMKKLIEFSIILTILAVSAAVGMGQTTSVMTTGLNKPTKVIIGPHNTLLVSENGTAVPNTGRVSVVDRATGARHTLISGLPSGVDNLGGPPSPDGTTSLLLDGQLLYLTSGVGDATIKIDGVEYPGEAPSSPIFDSVMQIYLPHRFESLDSEFHMTMNDQLSLATGRWVRIQNNEGRSMFARILADLPDYRSEPQPGIPDAIRSSHLFGIERVGWNLYVADASFNLIYRVNVFTGRSSVFLEMPTRPNPLFPTMGGPVIEAVPDNVHRLGRRLLIPELTGFPMVPGQSDVRSVDLRTGAISTLIPGLSSAMDVLAVEDAKCEMGYYALEFSTNFLANAPGRLRHFDSAGNATMVVPVLISPSSMARDKRTGDIFVTNIFPGTVTRIHF